MTDITLADINFMFAGRMDERQAWKPACRRLLIPLLHAQNGARWRRTRLHAGYKTGCNKEIKLRMARQ